MLITVVCPRFTTVYPPPFSFFTGLLTPLMRFCLGFTISGFMI